MFKVISIYAEQEIRGTTIAAAKCDMNYSFKVVLQGVNQKFWEDNVLEELGKIKTELRRSASPTHMGFRRHCESSVRT